MRTRITELFDISYPVMSAPMTSHSGGRLAAAVSQAGGLGSFGGIHPAGVDWLREQIGLVRSQTDNPFAVGFLTQYIPDYLPIFHAVLEERVPAIAFSFSDPAPWLGLAKAAGAINPVPGTGSERRRCSGSRRRRRPGGAGKRCRGAYRRPESAALPLFRH